MEEPKPWRIAQNFSVVSVQEPPILIVLTKSVKLSMCRGHQAKREIRFGSKKVMSNESLNVLLDVPIISLFNFSPCEYYINLYCYIRLLNMSNESLNVLLDFFGKK